MERKLFEGLKQDSKNYQATPPDRVWSRIEYKLDRAQFERKRNNKNKLIYGISVAAVIIFLISFISILKQDYNELGTDAKSEFIVNRSINNSSDLQQVYDVHILHDYYSKIEKNKYQEHLKNLKVNPSPKG
ncbi:MAG TPA: hypothetical protein ENK91_04075 [Bacteroidetes bacterium]|nr:hypothetical protein [Bacteroidota bacterium]